MKPSSFFLSILSTSLALPINYLNPKDDARLPDTIQPNDHPLSMAAVSQYERQPSPESLEGNGVDTSQSNTATITTTQSSSPAFEARAEPVAFPDSTILDEQPEPSDPSNSDQSKPESGLEKRRTRAELGQQISQDASKLHVPFHNMAVIRYVQAHPMKKKTPKRDISTEEAEEEAV